MTEEQQSSPIQTTDEAATDVNDNTEATLLGDSAESQETQEQNDTPESTEESGEESLLGDIVDSADADSEASEGEEDAEGEAEESDEPIEYDLKLPEGAHIDDSVLAEVKEFAEANKLTPEAAQIIVDRENRAAEGALQKAVSTYEQEVEDNRQALLKHPELGRDNMKKTDQLATAALSRFDKEGKLAALLKEGGHHVNPVVIGYLVEIGKALSPDTLHLGKTRSTGTGNSAQEIADTLFSNLVKQ